MIHHIVMFRFRDEVPQNTRILAQNAFKKGIEALPQTIPFIRSISVGININKDEKWHICLASTFDTLDDVKTYSAHPAHKAVAIELMKYIEQRACVDFE